MEDTSTKRAQIDGIKVNKQGREYVSNPALLKEIIESKKQDKLTDNAIQMFMLMCENLQRKKYYRDPEDKADCAATAMLDILLYWRNFDPEKSKNPFAFYTSMITNGLAKGWGKMHNAKQKDIMFVSLDNNIHTL